MTLSIKFNVNPASKRRGVCYAKLFGHGARHKKRIINLKEQASWFTTESTAYQEVTVQHQDNRTESDNLIIHDRLNAVIDEEEALKFSPCQDSNLAADPLKSTLQIIGSDDKIYYIGEKIFVMATLYDSYGRQKSSGGDQVRATISDSSVNASAPGVVFDHRNGSYTIIFEALWSGQSLISATVDYTREAITALYRLLVDEECLRLIWARYKSQDFEEDTVCHPDQRRLFTVFGYKYVCNFTDLVSGMPWYCGKPKDRRLECKDWVLVGNLPPEQDLPKSKSECDNILLAGRRHHQAITETITVTTRTYTPNNGGKIVRYYQPSTPCSKYNVTKLWFRKFTTGFYYNGTWKLRHCKEFHDFNFDDCLRNKRLYLLGDSTVRHWYEYILDSYDCKQITEKWTNEKWKKPSMCKLTSNNLTVSFAIHSLPHHAGETWIEKEFTLVSIPSRLENIDTNEDAIVLIHMFLHMHTFHNRFFRIKMQKIRDSIEKLLQRNWKVKVFIKMPHTFTQIFQSGRVNDFFGYVFTRIIIDTFKRLYNTRRIIILDNKDATLSISSETPHPSRAIVESMVNQMFSYLCEKTVS